MGDPVTAWLLAHTDEAAPQQRAVNSLGMTSGRLLLPIDLARCPPEIFPLATGLTRPVNGEIVLLHVLDRHARRRIDGGQAERHLRRIGRDYLHVFAQLCYRVRSGIPHEEIAAEAEEQDADMILLPVFAPSIWRRIAGSGYGATVRNLVSSASREILVMDVRQRIDCLRIREAGGRRRTNAL